MLKWDVRLFFVFRSNPTYRSKSSCAMFFCSRSFMTFHQEVLAASVFFIRSCLRLYLEYLFVCETLTNCGTTA